MSVLGPPGIGWAWSLGRSQRQQLVVYWFVLSVKLVASDDIVGQLSDYWVVVEGLPVKLVVVALVETSVAVVKLVAATRLVVVCLAD